MATYSHSTLRKVYRCLYNCLMVWRPEARSGRSNPRTSFLSSPPV